MHTRLYARIGYIEFLSPLGTWNLKQKGFCMREKIIEKELKNATKSMGGIALKLI